MSLTPEQEAVIEAAKSVAMGWAHNSTGCRCSAAAQRLESAVDALRASEKPWKIGAERHHIGGPGGLELIGYHGTKVMPDRIAAHVCDILNQHWTEP